jgi:hypothetical protein
MRKIFLLILLTYCYGTFAQNFKAKNHTISFDEKGLMLNSPPERLLDIDTISLSVTTENESFLIYKELLRRRVSAAKKGMEKPEIKKMLTEIYGFTELEISNLNTQFDVIIANPSSSVLNIPFFKSVDENYLKFISKGQVWDNKKEIKNFAKDENLSYSLVKENPFNKLLLNWADTKKVNYGVSIDITKINDLRVHADKISDTLGKILEREKTYERLSDEQILYLTENLKEINTQLPIILKSEFLPKKEWIKDWLWYTEGKPLLNPFPFKDPNSFEEPNSDSLKLWEAKLAIRDTLLKKLKYTIEIKGKLDTIIDERNYYAGKIAETNRLKSEYVNDLKSNKINLYNFTTTSKILNDVSLTVTSSKAKLPSKSPIYWMRHHDGAKQMREMNPTYHPEYLESDRVIIITHNLKPGQEANYGELVKLADERPQWVIDLTQAINGLNITQLIDLVKNKETRTNLLTAGEKRLWLQSHEIVNASDIPTYYKDQIKRYETLNEQIKLFKENQLFFTYITSQSNPYFGYGEAHKDSVASYHSDYSNFGKKRGGPKQIRYWINSGNSKDKPDTITYRVNNTYAILPAAGFAYTTDKFTDLELNSTNTGVVKQKNYNDLGLYVGLKFHIFRKVDIRNTKLCGRDSRGNHLFPSRLNLFVGTGIKNPIENIYLGGGYDIIPGFAVNFGTHLNKYTTYKFVNGLANVEDKKYRAGFYFGILTDVSLVTSIVNFFK